jgi:tetratricopeptide (TPR) repeat protein
MKKILIALLLITVQISFAQDCKTRAANKPSEFVRFQDVYERSVEDPKANIAIAKLKPLLTAAENWVKGILKNFTGAKLAYSNDYFFDYASGFTKDFYKATGIKGSYGSKMRFYAYYCYDNRNEIFTEDESGSFAAVYFNNVFIPSLCTDVGVFTINGKYAFKMFEKSRTEGRIDYYEQIAMSNVYDTIYKSKHDFIIIRNSDQPVFLPITRKEYLQQLLKDVDDYKSREMASAKAGYTPANEAANKVKFDEELKRIDNSKNYTPEQMAPYRKRFIETWETEKQKLDKRIARIETETNEAKEVLQEYLKKPQEWLNSSFKQFYGYSSYTGKGLRQYLENLDVFTNTREEETRTYVASLDPAYFNKSLSADIPQLIMVHLPKGTYPHMQKIAALIKKPGALAPLENLLTQGKHPVEQPLIASTSSYSLSYLPKLNKLTPLTVPADMKPSMVSTVPVNNPSATKLNFEIPSPSPKLKELPSQPFTSEAYKNYVAELHTKISNALKPEIKKEADDYLTNKKLTQSKDISNTAFAAWLQNTPEASLYLYSMAVVNDPSDALTANNFSAFLMMGGLPEKSIPILEFWNKQKPGESTLLANLGNAYYRLGDVNNAMKYLQQCVQKDSLHLTANKLLCIMYLKKGDTKKAEEHATRSITKSHDEEVVRILRQLNDKIKVGEVMSSFPPLPEKEFPMLKRIQLPSMPSSLDDMTQFNIELTAIKQSLKMTIAAIEAKHPKTNDNIQQQVLMASLKNGFSPIRIKAQYIILDGMQTYQAESIKEADVFKYNLKKLNAPHAVKMKAIIKKYDDQLSKLEGGEAGDEDKIQALELAKCKELNEETQAYLVRLSSLINQHAQRQEYSSRKFYRDYANWAPYWAPEKSISFPSIEIDYLNDVLNILSDYGFVSKKDCSIFEPLPVKEGTLQEWEDEYCANFKGKMSVGFAKLTWTCNSCGIEGGEGFVGAMEVNFSNGGVFEDFTIEGGLGAEMELGKSGIAEVEAGASVKEFIKIGKTNGKWEVKDFGVKGEISMEGSIGNISSEVKLIETTVAVNAGIKTEGIIAPLLPLK